MYRTTLDFLALSLTAALLAGVALAQQPSAPSTQQPPSTTAPKTQKPSTAKTSQASTTKKPAPPVLQTQKDKGSYAIGMNIGNTLKGKLKQDQLDADPDLIARGLKDALTGTQTLLTDDEAKTALNAMLADARKQVAEKNAAFLTENKDKPGVVTLPSGLQYKVLQEGNGPKPAATDIVVCNYRGTLIDGTEFDSSYKRSQPLTLNVSQVLKGWTEALQLMPVGSKWELYVPASLGYGERGSPNGAIGPNATLIFEIELLSIQPKPQPKLLVPGEPEPKPETQQQAPPQPQTPPQTAPQSQTPPPSKP